MSDDQEQYECPEHGTVSPTERQHGGRAHSFVCPVGDCNRTVKRVDVDWDAYHEAKENGENPPCPGCGSPDIITVPAKPKYRCQNCGHDFGVAGAYR